MGINTEARESVSWENGGVILETIPRVLIFVSFHCVVALYYQDSQLESDPSVFQFELGIGSLACQGLS